MIQKILSYQSKTLTGAAIMLGLASLLSRIVGVLRDHILAGTFGAGSELDMYTAAFRIPDFVYSLLIAGALSAGFIPIFLNLYTKNKKEAWEFTSRVMNTTLIAVSFLCILLFIFAPQILHILVPGFSPAERATTLSLTRIMILGPLILGLSAVISAVLQSLKSFLVYSLAPLFYNLGIISGALFLVPRYGIIGLGYGVLLGASLHLLIQIPVLFKNGFHYKPLFSWKDKTLQKLFRMMIPRAFTLASTQTTTLFITSFASVLGVGSIAIFNFANNIASLPIGIIGVSFALAAFPTLSEYANQKDMSAFKKQLSLTIGQILFFIIPLAILFILLRAQIVRVILGSGQFNWDDTISTASTVAMLSLSFFSESLILLISRAFYAIHNTRTPLYIAIFSSILIVTSSFTLKMFFGLPGLALGISLGSIVQFFLLWTALKKNIGKFSNSMLWESIFKILAASSVMGIITQTLKYPLSEILNLNTFFGIFLHGLISGLGGLILYAILSYIFKIQEMHVLCSSLKRKWLKIRNIPLDEDSLK